MRTVLASWQWLRERPHLRAFVRFYEGLENQRDIFYMPFSSGLLHWVTLTASFVPESVNLVLVGWDLRPEEVTWIQQHIARPFHHIELAVDDKTVWEFLFHVNRQNFGWMDVDLCVLNPRILEEMAAVDPGTSINCIWSYRTRQGLDILCTHLLFVNAEAIRRLRREGFRTSPCTYSYKGDRLGRHLPHGYSKKPTKAEIALLRKLLPSGEDRCPSYPSADQRKFGFECFDTMVLFQLVCQSFGYRLHKVRGLSGISATPGHYSDELIHVNGVSYYGDFEHEKDIFGMLYRLILPFDYLVLDSMCRAVGLPASYLARLEELRGKLDALRIDRERCAAVVARYLTGRGVSESVFAHAGWKMLWARPEE